MYNRLSKAYSHRDAASSRQVSDSDTENGYYGTCGNGNHGGYGKVNAHVDLTSNAHQSQENSASNGYGDYGNGRATVYLRNVDVERGIVRGQNNGQMTSNGVPVHIHAHSSSNVAVLRGTKRDTNLDKVCFS
jgi:hypothetical protein